MTAIHMDERTDDDRHAIGGDRRLAPLVAALAAIVVLVAIVAVHRSVTAESLAADGPMSRFPGQTVEDPFDDEAVVEVPYRHDEEYSFDFTLVNHSRWPTRVVGFPVSRFDALLRLRNVEVDQTPFGDAPRFVTFRPFSLGSDRSVVVRVHARFANCGSYGPGSSSTLTAVAIRHRTLWATRTRFVDFPTGIEVPAPPLGSCPER
jgi:hypothetical protein